MMTSAEIRKKFLDFFVSKGHTIVPSAPIVVKNDPTLKFTNAGMNQFKDYFLGNKKSPHARVADTQKCLRVSGKHNDLEEVGVDTYHHTMFEMLGNWSFGDPANPAAGYFKKEAIAWSWELLTAVYDIPEDRMYVTVFEGDEANKLPRDTEAYEEWKKWIAPKRILLGSKKDNFWEMGDTGPCGPCTEIHVDCRSDAERDAVAGATLVNNDHPQVIEIWNNVFIQFNRLKDGSLQPLPAKHVDTGMGLERLVRVMQGKHSNYDTDLFTGTIARVEAIVGKKYSAGDGIQDVAFRVLADHLRAISFTIADGQLPSNTEAGYVIRRILRRAVRYYYSYLDYKKPLLFQLVPLLAAQFKTVFPELDQQADFVAKVVREEEEAFLRTLEKGLRRMDDLMSALRGSAAKLLPGSAAFELYDTYGFPIDLTGLIARENGFTVDQPGFEAEMQKQKDRSRAATAIDTEDWMVLVDNPLVEFVGYEMLETNTQIVKYRKIKAKGKESWQLVLEATPFYAESGGQVGDTGILHSNGEMISVLDTRKEHDLIVHFTDKLPSDPEAPLIATVDRSKRKATEVHHSATHLLHAALRKVLGTHVAQKGSLVNAGELRFDFSHFAKTTEEELSAVEALVNEKIRENIPVVIRQMPKDEALKLGAMALFGEKYGDVVRVVIIDPDYSVELCGGTHVGATGELGYFKIRHEGAVAAGVRRIEAVSGPAAEAFLSEQFIQLRAVREALKNPPELSRAAETLVAENAELKKKLEKAEAKQLAQLRQQLLTQVQTVGGVAFIGEVVEVGSVDALKKLCFDLKSGLAMLPNTPLFLAVLAANIEGKAAVALLVDEQLVATRQLEAPAIIKQHVAPLIKGGGGGQKTLATAGGQDTSHLAEVIAAVRNLLAAK
ncbi:alanine--tRNA ligase [Puia dinghuensis]|uniref:Alanine--tRNA ligase n=1 Tax=Puia dinghuensis TaxID=1792502 RepID=A0A8J2UEX3_9BACT|nr:alanine--tRNA ligase [Puia dinghuensis]GGB08129.1 alanine--tRNA ligase [Puia dinghuensis]